MPLREARATAFITLVTVIVSLLLLIFQMADWAALTAGFVPAAVKGGLPDNVTAVMFPVWLTPLTATLVHASVLHVALNMVMLVYCGREAERVVGWSEIAILYVVGAYAAALGQWVQDPNGHVPMIGASGAISAIVAAYSLFYGRPRARAIGFIPASVVHVLWLAAAWVGLQLLIGVSGISGTQQIAIGAHIGGFLAGLLLARPLLLWRYRNA
jgi:membrane associated rhomboid family serine protease